MIYNLIGPTKTTNASGWANGVLPGGINYGRRPSPRVDNTTGDNLDIKKSERKATAFACLPSVLAGGQIYSVMAAAAAGIRTKLLWPCKVA